MAARGMEGTGMQLHDIDECAVPHHRRCTLACPLSASAARGRHRSASRTQVCAPPPWESCKTAQEKWATAFNPCTHAQPSSF
eukprot:1161720-Pelagomonas_calceolata.AAC.6